MLTQVRFSKVDFSALIEGKLLVLHSLQGYLSYQVIVVSSMRTQEGHEVFARK